ncbi:hypothetical protein HK096_002300 [Nowakowskiella sp. JEL0078]|nr:hypothetical protein HK096_002300 [Nowakowskiella sp. JEL0078]
MLTSIPNNVVSSCKKIIGLAINFRNPKNPTAQIPVAPVTFLKPTTSLLLEPNQIELPANHVTVHEVELGVIIGKSGRDIKKEDANSYIAGYVLALDMTDQTELEIAKKNAFSWNIAKGFDTFTPVSEFIPKSAIHDHHAVELWLKINGKIVQEGDTKDLIFDIPSTIEYVSSVMKLNEGDLILTGTPPGVGPVFDGDVLNAGLRLRGSEADIVTITFPARIRKGTGLFSVQN